MKLVLILNLVFLLIVTNSYADRYYVFMDKIGIVHKDEEAGCTAYGDVVAVHPCTPQYKPTRAELSRYKIVVTDLTEQEREILVEPDFKGVDPQGDPIRVKARKRNVDIDKITAKQEEEVAKSVIFDNTSVSLSP